MASITLKDYLISLSTKGSISNGDLLPLLDSDSSNAIKTITKGTLVNLSDIDGFAEFSSSVQGDIFALSFASGATVETSLQQQIDLNNLGVYTQSLKNAITVDGNDVQIIGELRADKFYVNYITSSVSLLTGSNEFGDTLADRHTFIGDVYINGDGPIGLLQLNTQTGSQNSINSGVSAVTGAFATELGSIDSHILGVSQQSSSQGLINTGISAVTGAFATELGQLQNNVTDFTNVLSGVAAVSGAIVTELGGIQNNITSFNGVFGGVSAVTGAFSTELGQLQTQNTSQGGVNTGISAVTGAFATELNGIQGDITTAENNISSFDSVFDGVSFVTAAFANELGDIQTTLSGHRDELSGIEAWTASLDSTYATDAQVADADAGLNTQTGSQNSINTGTSAVTGAFATELGEIQTQLTNRRDELTGLEAYTASLKSVGLISSSAIIVNNNDIGISGSLYMSGSIIPATLLGSYTSSFSLGSDTNAWKELWVSNGSVNFVNPNTGETASISLTDDNRISIPEFETVGNLTVTGSMSVGRQLKLPGKSTLPSFNGDPIGNIKLGSFENLIYTNNSSELVIHTHNGLYLDVGQWDSTPNFVNITGSLRLHTPAVAGEGYTPNNDLTSLIVGGKSEFSSSVDISGSFTLNDILTITPRTTTPTSPQSGSFIVSSSGATIKPFFYDGNQWQEISFI